MATKKVFTSLDFQSGAKLLKAKIDPQNANDLSGEDPTFGASAGQLAYGDDTNLYLGVGAEWKKLYRQGIGISTASVITSTLESNSGNAPPFVVASTDMVANLNADKLDGYDTSTTAVANKIPVYATNGTLKVSDPLTGDDAANRRYVDSAVQGLDHKESVRLATTGNLSSTLSGTTLTGTGGGVLPLDGVNIVAGDRVLVKNQNTSAHNGIYTVTNPGSSGVAFVLERATDASEGPNLLGDNGNFDNDSDLDAWNHNGVGAQARDSSNNYLKLTNASSGANPRARTNSIAFATEIGKTYKFSYTNITGSGTGFAHLGTSAGGSEIKANVSTSAGSHSFTFQATNTVVYIQFGLTQNTASTHTSFDDVSIVQVELTEGAFVFVEEGSAYANTSWVMTSSNTWAQFSGAGQITVTSTSGASTATDGPLIKTGDTIDFGYNENIFNLDSNKNLHIKPAGIGGDRLQNNSVTPTQLQDTGAFLMGRLGIGTGNSSGGALGIQHGAANQVNITHDGASTNEWGLLLGHGNGSAVGSYHGLDNAAVINVVNAPLHLGTNNAAIMTLASGKVIVGRTDTPSSVTPNGTLHVQTARYSTTNEITDGNAISTTNWSTTNSTGMTIGTPSNKATYNDGVSASLTQTGIFTQSTDAGKRYKLTFTIEAKSEVTFTNANLWIGRQDGSQGYVDGAYNDYGLGTHEVFFDLPTHASATGLAFYASSSGSAFVISNISLYEDLLSTSGSATFANLSLHSRADDLLVNNNDHAGLTILSPSDKYGSIHFSRKGENFTGAGVLNYLHSDDQFRFYAASGTPSLILGSDAKFNGGVGINGRAASTTSALDIKSISSSSAASGINIQSNSGNYSVVMLGEKSTEGGRFHLAEEGVTKISFYSDGTDNVINAGNLAIGQTSADEKLDVFGNIQLRGSIYATAKIETDTSGKLKFIANADTAYIASTISFNLPLNAGSGTIDEKLLITNDYIDHKSNSIVNSATVAGLQDSACYDFNDTDSYIQLASSGVGIFDKQAFTISTWVKLKSSRTNDSVIFSYDYTSHATPYYATHLRVDVNGKIYFYWNDGSEYQALLSGNGAFTDDTWHHVVVNYKSGSQKIYVDGVEQASATNTDTITYYAQEVWIGKGNYSGGELDGSVRDFKYIPSWLDAADVRKLYSGENPKKNDNVNLVTNGTFDSDYSGWSAGAQSGSAPSLSISSNRLLVVNNATGNVPYAVYAATTVSGRMYKFQADVIYSNATIDVAVDSGTAGGTNLIDGSNVGSSGAEGTQTYFFTATSTTTYLSLRVLTTSAGANGLFDNISLQEVGTLVDFTPQSASSSKWRNEALLGFYDGTVNNATLSQGNTYWNNIKQSSDGVELSNLGIGTAPTTWKATISDGTTTGFINAYNNALSFGTNTDHALKLYQNGTVAFQLDASGNSKVENKLGVGTAAGTDQLLVLGDTRIKATAPNLQLEAGANSDSWLRLTEQANHEGGFIHYDGSANVFSIGVHDGDNTTSASDNKAINIKRSNGAVGIGDATAPNKNLEIGFTTDNSSNINLNMGSSGNGVLIENNATNAGSYACLDFRANNADGRIAYTYDDANTGAFHFVTDNSNTIAEVFKIGADGTQYHKGNRIVNSQTVNDSWRSSEPSLRFDGSNDVVTVGSTTNYGSKATVAVWVKFNKHDAADNGREGIVGSAYWSDNNFSLHLHDSGRLMFTSGSGIYSSWVANTAYNVGVWNHLCLVYDSTQSTNTNKAKLYINGVLITVYSSGNHAGDLRTDSGLKIGKTEDTHDGEIKDVRIHNRALDADEVKGLYNGESTPWVYADAGAELISNGDFSDTSSWTLHQGTNATTSFGSGVLTISNSSSSTAFTGADQSITVVKDKIYRLKLDVTVNNGAIYVRDIQNTTLLYTSEAMDSGGSETPTISSTVTGQVYYFKAVASGTFTLRISRSTANGNTISVNVDNVSIQQIGEVAAYTPQSINDDDGEFTDSKKRWYDTTSNANHGDITGATVVGYSDLLGTQRIIGRSSTGDADADGRLVLGNHSSNYGFIEFDEASGQGITEVGNNRNANGAKVQLTVNGDPKLIVHGDGEVQATRDGGSLKQVARVHTDLITFGDNDHLAFRILHNLGTKYVTVSVCENSTSTHSQNAAHVETEVRIGDWVNAASAASLTTQQSNTDENYVTIIFAANHAENTAFKVTVIG